MPRAQARPCRRVRDGVTIKVYKINDYKYFILRTNSLSAAPGPAPLARGPRSPLRSGPDPERRGRLSPVPAPP